MQLLLGTVVCWGKSVVMDRYKFQMVQIWLFTLVQVFPLYIYIYFRPEEPITHLVVCNNFLVMAMSHGVIMRLDLEHADDQERMYLWASTGPLSLQPLSSLTLCATYEIFQWWIMKFMPPFEEEVVYCFAHVSRSVGRSVRP